MKSSVRDVDLGWKGVMKAAADLSRGAYCKVGVLADDERGGLHKTDPETGKSSPLTVAEIAVVDEYGTEDGQIPARPAHRSTFDRMKDELARDAFKLMVKLVIDRTITVEDALNTLGMKLAAGIKATITEGAGVPPPNAPSTLARKESAGGWNRKGKAQASGAGPRTLVDTARTLAAISWGIVIGTTEKAHRFLTKR